METRERKHDGGLEGEQLTRRAERGGRQSTKQRMFGSFDQCQKSLEYYRGVSDLNTHGKLDIRAESVIDTDIHSMELSHFWR